MTLPAHVNETTGADVVGDLTHMMSEVWQASRECRTDTPRTRGPAVLVRPNRTHGFFSLEKKPC